MRLRMAFTLLAACGVATAAAPLWADQPISKSAKDPNEQICKKETILGSRLTTRRVCWTRAEWEEKQRLDREAIEKAQTQIGVIKI
jgi:hypothetical protein